MEKYGFKYTVDGQTIRTLYGEENQEKIRRWVEDIRSYEIGAIKNLNSMESMHPPSGYLMLDHISEQHKLEYSGLFQFTKNYFENGINSVNVTITNTTNGNIYRLYIENIQLLDTRIEERLRILQTTLQEARARIDQARYAPGRGRFNGPLPYPVPGRRPLRPAQQPPPYVEGSAPPPYYEKYLKYKIKYHDLRDTLTNSR